MPKRKRLRCRGGRSLLNEALDVARDQGQAGRSSPTFSIAAQYELNRVHPGWRKLVASAYIGLAIPPADLYQWLKRLTHKKCFGDAGDV